MAPEVNSDGEPQNLQWAPEVSLQIRGVQQVRVSPDATRVVYVVREGIMKPEQSEYITQLHLAATDGSLGAALTYGEKSSQNPQWSPSGSEIAFTSNRKEKSNLYLLRLLGGEAEPLTDCKADVGSFAWSPDGAQIAFLMPNALTDEEEKANKGRDDARWVDEDHKRSHLYRIPLQQNASGKREVRRLTHGDYHINSFDWSPDGRHIVFAHQPTPVADEWVRSAVSTVEVETQTVREIVPVGTAASQPYYSPDGTRIALSLSDEQPPRWTFSSLIHIVPAEGGEARALPATHDMLPTLIGWSADGSRIYYVESQGTTSRLAAIHVESGQITDISPACGCATEYSLNSSRTHVGFSYQSTEAPVEAYTAWLQDYMPRAVSRANASVPRLPECRTDILRWQSADGREIEGLLTLPAGYQDGQRVPLLLVIHGGPAGVFLQTFLGNPSIYPLATFAERGYATLRCNPRGSQGYGKEFRLANRRDWGGGDYQDLMSGVDHVIGLGIADPERLGVMGWSYGGFMTSWVITHTHRFKAASVGAAVTNLMSFTGTADIPGFIPDYFDGQFWDDPETYRQHSPMFHVKGVTTPSLIQHGEADIRVPISQGYELYNALKAQGVPTRMLVLPRQPHGPNEPKLMLKTLQSNLEWFEKYLPVGT